MEKKRTPKVVIFTTSSCPWCRKTKEYLKAHKIPFKEVNVQRNPSAARDLVRMTGQTGVPVLLINNRPVVGFNKPMIDRLLGIK
ncbi:glutathione S-transferase N-terminal domain-containing protein [candidate division WOR-3 bacterium]|uniref:NrdH-redoxin n=1 Tax=candidate division WOR-3 bacterium TaxID=2052148 RepID=A0A7C0VD92_UNCW3|nr:glutathione S-transferase N-terminal domain-containing protein [candidate division WOR-3 bacterium]RKZ17646.1 MAG: NrdH-redoxin [bacterium]HDI82838.1 NrdH-redoxin [candidate division WOR-3 bacterium]